MLRLHYYPGNANLAPHIVLEELGVAYELALVDRTRDAQRDPAYLALNPAGRIPTLVDGELVVFETAAIVLHLVDAHPDAGLAPRTLPHVAALADRVFARPAAQRAMAAEGLSAPFF